MMKIGRLFVQYAGNSEFNLAMGNTNQFQDQIFAIDLNDFYKEISYFREFRKARWVTHGWFNSIKLNSEILIFPILRFKSGAGLYYHQRKVCPSFNNLNFKPYLL
jgi:hypothetical protein